MLISTLAAYVGDHSTVDEGQYFSCGAYTPYPYSRGSVHIKSRSVFDNAEFHCGFLTDPLDLEKLVWGYKLQRDIVRRMSHYRGALQAGHPTFPSGSKAGYDAVDKASAARGSPVPITYSKEDDKAIESFIRERVQTTWHSMGTCAMKPREANGVVDGNLDVYGVSKLKIVGEFCFRFSSFLSFLTLTIETRLVDLPIQRICKHICDRSRSWRKGSLAASKGPENPVHCSRLRR